MKLSLNKALKVLAIIALAIYIGWFGVWATYVHHICEPNAAKVATSYLNASTDAADSAYNAYYQACVNKRGL